MLLYLSRLVLNPQSGTARRDTDNPWTLHQTLMHGFPPHLPADERVLFRVEPTRHEGAAVVLVQSTHEPDWSFFTAADSGYSRYLRDTGAANPAVKPLQLELTPGDELVFRLWANPTVKKEGQRLGLLDAEEQLEWLRRKATLGGFTLLAVRATKTEFVEGRRPDTARRERMRFFGVLFDGRLRVLHPAELEQAVRHGLGPGKGLGFGLLSLARPELAQ